MNPLRAALRLQEKLNKHIFRHNAGYANGGFGPKHEAYDMYCIEKFSEGKSNLIKKNMTVKGYHFPKGKLI